MKGYKIGDSEDMSRRDSGLFRKHSSFFSFPFTIIYRLRDGALKSVKSSKRDQARLKGNK